MPRYFFDEHDGYVEPNDPNYERTPNGWLTSYERGGASFDPAALEGEEARVYRILRERGVSEVVIGYDGGNDAGFAHFEQAVVPTARLLPDDLARELCAGPLGDVPLEPYFFHRKGDTPSREEWAKEALMGYAYALASRVLGRGFGTGQYVLIGRVRADLLTGQITDEDRPDEPPSYEPGDSEDE